MGTDYVIAVTVVAVEFSPLDGIDVVTVWQAGVVAADLVLACGAPGDARAVWQLDGVRPALQKLDCCCLHSGVTAFRAVRSAASTRTGGGPRVIVIGCHRPATSQSGAEQGLLPSGSDVQNAEYPYCSHRDTIFRLYPS